MAADEKRFSALGRDWIARFDFNAICEIEDRFDRPFLEMVAPLLSGVSEADKSDPVKVAQAASRIKMSDLRAIMYQSLLDAQPETTATDTGNIIADIGIDGAMGIVGWAVVKAMPSGGGDGAASANPPKGRKG